jgi:Bacterial Ig-like domain
MRRRRSSRAEASPLRFSEGLDEATVTPENIQILDGGEPVDGELAYSGVVSTFTPTRRLSLLATYDVAVSDGVTDLAGNPLKEPFTSSFAVRDGTWSAQRSIFTDATIDSGRQDVASDAQGNALFVWTTRTDETGNKPMVAYARWNNLATGLKAEVKLDDCADYCNNLRVAVSPEGDAVAAWTTNGYLVRARRYVGGAWEAQAKTLWTTPSTNVPEPAVAIGGGQVVVAWAHHQVMPSNYYLIEMSATTVDGAWPTTPTANYSVAYQAPNYDSIGGFGAAVDNAGLALVVFVHSSSNTAANSPRGVYYARKSPGVDWEYPVKIASSNAVSSGAVLASDGAGAMAMWISTAGSDYSLVASRYTRTKQFVAPVPINDPDLKGYIYLGRDYALAGNNAGFFATWSQAVGNLTNTYATRFDIATSKWDALPALVSDGVAESRDNRAIGLDAHGNAIVAFDQNGPTTSMVLAARYVASTGKWGAAEPLTSDGNDYGFPRLAVAPDGVASLFFGPTYRDGPLRGAAPRGEYRLFR